jgi:hypothetical protein|tara:strand:+ start:1339 stop:1788 length:450 start_codon:yes stop_codon:yes gene_type:complete
MADLSVTISENVTINNAVRGTTNTLTTSDIVDVYERTITCTHSQTTTIATFGATPHASAGALDYDNAKYIRVTNLDSTNECEIAFVGSATLYQVRLRAGASHILCNGDDILLAEADTSPSFGTMEDLASIQVKPIPSENIQVEIFVASV